MVRKIVEKVPAEVLKQDLEKYRRSALELGATDAKVITSDMVLIDERVRAKCMFPPCRFYGTNVHCPPHASELELTRGIVKNFHYAIFYMIKVPSEEVAGPKAKERKLFVRSQLLNFKIAAKVESEAFYDGYHLAMGFAGGPCKSAYCPNVECSALIPGQGCRHSLKARASMEGMGMDGPSNQSVEIVFHEKVGPHDITAVHVNSPVEFTDWVNTFLKNKGISNKKLPNELNTVVAHYTDQDIRYFVFDVIDLEPNQR